VDVIAATGTGTVDSLKHGLGFVEVAPELCREALERLLYHAYRLGGTTQSPASERIELASNTLK
jgi:hypothetical protein